MKRNVNIDRKTLASGEINATKDFGAAVSKVGGVSGVPPKSPKKGFSNWIITGISAIVVAASIFFGSTNTSDTTTPQLAQTNVSELDSAKSVFINPPISSAVLPSDSYVINADKGGEIKHHTGTDINIPEGAFMDENGNVVTGEVEIQYREFHDQADIFLSGIPMDYDTLGENRIFESAGMLEIRGFQNGKRLKITPNKNFRICMKTKDPDPKFNLYHLNEKDEKWDYEGKDSISIPKLDNTVSLAKKYDDLSSGENLDFTDPEIKEDIKETTEEIAVIKKEIKKIKKTEPSKPIKASKDKKNFTIDVVKSEYPELAVYSGTIFEVKENEDLPEDTYSVTWNDVKLKEKNSSYLVQLSKGERTEEISVIPVLEGKNYEQAKAIFDNKFGEYNTKLDKKIEEEKEAEKTLAKLKEKFRQEREEWERKQQEIRDRMTTAQASREVMQRVFKINRFGTWNCDTPVKYPTGMIVKAEYVDQNGEELEFVNLNLIEKQRNACFPLTAGMIKKLPFNPKRTNTLWGVTTHGDIAVGKPVEFDKAGRTHTFQMDLIDVKGKSNSEIKKLIAS
ncbi:MAG: hypothetical protein ABF242_04345 [Flavobacteriales bacterium]